MARVLLIALLAACVPPPDFWAFSSTTSTTQGTSSGFTGIAVWTSDSPVDFADNVWVTVDRVELDGIVLSTQRQRLDYLALRNGVRALLARAEVPEGVYDALRIRLAADGHSIVVGGATHPLAVRERVLVMPGPFRMRGGESIDLHLDLNVRLSVIEAGGAWSLQPAVVLTDAARGVFLEGVVRNSAGHALPGATVSAQEGGLEIGSTRTEADGRFRVGPLPASGYTLVATAAGYAPDVVHGAGAAGNLLVLTPSFAGDVAGIGPPGQGLTARLMRDGLFLGLAGVDPATGRYAFAGVPAGEYDVEIWGPAGLKQVVKAISE